jgi:peptidoglycan/LPS O-acetylase OafA/YrhL
LQWPRGRAIAWLGKVSYSLFLVHFPVLVLVATVWTHLEWHSPAQAVAGLGMSFLLSLLAAVLFHRWVEQPASALGHRYRYQKAG